MKYHFIRELFLVLIKGPSINLYTSTESEAPLNAKPG